MVTQRKQNKDELFREKVATRWREFKQVMEGHYTSEYELNTVKNAFLAGIAASEDGGISKHKAHVLCELVKTPESEI